MSDKSMKHISKKTAREMYARNRKIMLIMFIFGFIFGIGILIVDLPSFPRLYETHIATRTDPLYLLQQMKKGKFDKFLLIDTRSKKDFLKSHIKSADSFPLYDEKGELMNPENALIKEFKEKYKDEKREIILYGTYGNSPIVGEFSEKLSSSGIKTSELAVGWNEWRHFRNLWLPESMWNTIQMDEYVSE